MFSNKSYSAWTWKVQVPFRGSRVIMVEVSRRLLELELEELMELEELCCWSFEEEAAAAASKLDESKLTLELDDRDDESVVEDEMGLGAVIMGVVSAVAASPPPQEEVVAVSVAISLLLRSKPYKFEYENPSE